jgi:hypothetical protein
MRLCMCSTVTEWRSSGLIEIVFIYFPLQYLHLQLDCFNINQRMHSKYHRFTIRCSKNTLYSHVFRKLLVHHRQETAFCNNWCTPWWRTSKTQTCTRVLCFLNMLLWICDSSNSFVGLHLKKWSHTLVNQTLCKSYRKMADFDWMTGTAETTQLWQRLWGTRQTELSHWSN